MTCNDKYLRKNLFSETFNCERKVQNDENVLRSLNKRVYLRIILHRVSMTVLLFTPSCDWETVKNVVPGNSSSKPDQLGGEGQGAEQSSNAFRLF